MGFWLLMLIYFVKLFIVFLYAGILSMILMNCVE